VTGGVGDKARQTDTIPQGGGGELRWAEVTAGPIEYRDTGGDGPVLVLLHGLIMDGTVWDDVVAELGHGIRCILPTLPLGAHRRPMRPDADLSLRGLGAIVAEFLATLELTDVMLCFNDWGGAQTMIADGLMERVGKLVLTPCEAFENYPPGLAGKVAGVSATLPGGLTVTRLMLLSPLRRLPMIYGQMTKRGVPQAQMRAWVEPLKRAEIRSDLAKYAGDWRSGRSAMLAATPTLSTFARPVLIVWSSEGRMMSPAHGGRLAAAFPDSRLVELPESYTLMPIDQPAALARELRSFMAP
jgi:pimeloyl-ACP methyl ester carboxylesterase